MWTAFFGKGKITAERFAIIVSRPRLIILRRRPEDKKLDEVKSDLDNQKQLMRMYQLQAGQGQYGLPDILIKSLRI